MLPGLLILRQVPLNNFLRTTTHRTITSPLSPINQVPTSRKLLRSISSCVVLELELHYNEASIATGDPNTGGIVNPVLELRPFPHRKFTLKICFCITSLIGNPYTYCRV